MTVPKSPLEIFIVVIEEVRLVSSAISSLRCTTTLIFPTSIVFLVAFVPVTQNTLCVVAIASKLTDTWVALRSLVLFRLRTSTVCKTFIELLMSTVTEEISSVQTEPENIWSTSSRELFAAVPVLGGRVPEPSVCADLSSPVPVWSEIIDATSVTFSTVPLSTSLLVPWETTSIIQSSLDECSWDTFMSIVTVSVTTFWNTYVSSVSINTPALEETLSPVLEPTTILSQLTVVTIVDLLDMWSLLEEIDGSRTR